MPVVYRDMIQGEPTLGTEIPSSRGDVLTEQFAQTFEENPIKAASRFFALREDERTGPMLDATTARQKLKDAGLDAHLKVNDAGITQAALDTLMERKRTELRRQEIFSRAQGGAAEFSERLGLSIATTLSDPISMGLNFVPVVGQARYARWLGEAGSIAGRIGIRAGVGAAEGAVGAALQEPFIYSMRTQEQADYSMADSLLNVALGGITGGGLHASVGSAAEGADRLLGRASEFPLYRGLSLDQIDVLRKAPSSTRQQLAKSYLRARAAQDDFAASLRSVASDVGADYKVGKLKEVPRALEKVLADYGGDAARVKDLLRGTLVVDSLEQADRAVTAIEARLGALSKIKNSLRDAAVSFSGYRDININATVRGQTVELQIHVPEMVAAKTNGGHQLYARMRAIEARAATEKRILSVSEQEEIADLGRQQRELYAAAWEAFLARSRNSPSEIRAPLLNKDEGGNGRPEGVSQAVQETPGTYATGTSSTSANSVPDGNVAGRVIASSSRRSIPVDASVRDFDLTAAEKAGLARPGVREAALRAAVGQAVEGRPINVEGIFDPQSFVRDATEPEADSAQLRASQAADEIIEHEPVMGSTEERLNAAEEDAALAVADAKASAKRLGQEYTEDEALTENLAKAERWARIAELATVCLTR